MFGERAAAARGSDKGGERRRAGVRVLSAFPPDPSLHLRIRLSQGLLWLSGTRSSRGWIDRQNADRPPGTRPDAPTGSLSVRRKRFPHTSAVSQGKTCW